MTRPMFSAILALAMISFAGWSIAAKYSPRQVARPPIEAPANPYDNDVAGAGIVEPASEVIALAIERGGVVFPYPKFRIADQSRASRENYLQAGGPGHRGDGRNG
jgi:hypothetical protein